MEERVFVKNIKKRFYNDFTEQFPFSLSALLFKFMIDRGVGHIVEPRPSLIEPPSNTKWAENQKVWEKFVVEREWE